MTKLLPDVKSLQDLLDRAKRFLFRRQYAYRKVFDGPYGEEVLADLARFCRAHESTFHADARAEGRLDGRREVWLRIQHQLNLSQDQLWRLYGKDKEVI